MSICPAERYTLEINGTEREFFRIHFIKSHPTPDPDTFDIQVGQDVGELINYFDTVEIKKDGISDFYGFVEKITPQVGQSGLTYKVEGRCWKLIIWKKFTERFVDNREIGPAGEKGFFGNVYPQELIMFLMRCPISVHPANLIRHKIGWGIPSDSWVCNAIATATGHLPVWVATRRIGFEWQMDGNNYIGTDAASVFHVCDAASCWDNTQSQWVKHGVAPYLNDDDGVNYIEADNLNDEDQYYTFEQIPRRGNIGNLTLYVKGRFVDDGGTNPGDVVTVTIRIFVNGIWSCDRNLFYDNTEVAWTLESIDASACLSTYDDFNNMKIAVKWSAATQPASQHPEVTYVYFRVTGAGSDYQTDGDWFCVDLGASYDDVCAILIECRNDITESQFARHFVIEVTNVANCPSAGWTQIRYVWWNFARDILLSWIPVDNVRCIRIRITQDADYAWEISQIYVWQSEQLKYRLINEGD